MGPDWLPHLTVEADPVAGFRAEWRVAPESPWFDGHFPGRPILPGLGMLALVVRLARQGLDQPGLRLARVLKCRFKGIVAPGDRLQLALVPGDPTPAGARPVRFELLRGDEPIGQGKLELSEAS